MGQSGREGKAWGGGVEAEKKKKQTQDKHFSGCNFPSGGRFPSRNQQRGGNRLARVRAKLYPDSPALAVCSKRAGKRSAIFQPLTV